VAVHYVFESPINEFKLPGSTSPLSTTISTTSMDTLTPPPGLSGSWSPLNEGPPGADWLPFKGVKHYTNAYIVRDDKVIHFVDHHAVR
jgi:hypothetical protein